MMTLKVPTTDSFDLTPIQVQEKVVTKHAFLRLPHRKCMGKSLIGCKCCKKKVLKYFSGSRSTTNEPKFKILCNCIHELLNVFEDSAQHIHTIHTSCLLALIPPYILHPSPLDCFSLLQLCSILEAIHV